ncbi:MAG: hypothetical protein NTU44_10935 [Bacteroidetes bacterium]|nr:hypothetical protein [Bacteroidota bacterium]
MPVKKKTKKTKKIKYKKITFKVTEKQKQLIDRFCKAKRTTPTKMIKSAIRDHLSRYSSSLPESDYISENQLKLFDEDVLEEMEMVDNEKEG